MAEVTNAESTLYDEEIPLPEVRRVAISAPLRWLQAGVTDLRHCPVLSLLYGGALAVIGFALLLLGASQIHLVVTATTLFLLAGPFLAAALYAVAHRHESGAEVSLKGSFALWRDRFVSVGLFTALIAIVMVFWVRLSWLLIGLAFAGREELGLAGLLSGLDYTLLYVATGALLAAFVFAISVVSLPLIYHRDVDIVTAMITSLKAVRRNLLPMLFWASLIVALTLLAMLPFMLGLIVVFPILAYASWHAYRDLVS